MPLSRFLLPLLAAFAACSAESESTPEAVPLEESPGHAAYVRFEEAVKKGDLALAVRELEGAVEADPKRALYHAQLGGLLGKAGKYLAAKRRLEAGIEQCGETSTLLYNLGMVHYNLQDFAGAEASLKRAAELDPSASLVHHNLGLVHWRMASVVVGAQNIDRKRANKALKSFARASELEPNAPDPLYWIGTIHKELGEDFDALESFQKAAELAPQNPRILLGAADAAKRLTNYKQARRYYDTVLEIDPNSAPAHFGVGEMASRNNKWEKAKDAYAKAIECDPEFVAAYYGLSTAHRRLDQPDEAEAALEAFQKINAETQQAFNEELGASTHQVTAQEYYELGVHAESKDDLDRAIVQYEKALEIDPRLADAHVRLGALLYPRGRLAEAHDHLKFALELDPTNSQVRHHLSEVMTLIKHSPDFDEITGEGDDAQD